MSQPCRVIVINLDRDFERLAHVSAELARAGLAFERFSAIDGDMLPGWLRHYLGGAEAALSRGETGCYASHLAVCRDVAEQGAPALVLEDDVALPAAFGALLTRLLAALPAGWDIVRLSYPSKRAMLSVAQIAQTHKLVRYSHIPTSTGAYLLSAQGARKFLSAPVVRRNPVDHDLRRAWVWRLETYGVAPPPVRADALLGSSIDAMQGRAERCARRRARLRWQRRFEGMSRFRQGAHDFGLWRWLLAEALNSVGMVLPKAARQRLFAAAPLRLAHSDERYPASAPDPCRNVGFRVARDLD